MEKPPPGRSKGKAFLWCLPKATSFSVPSTPYSPTRDRAHAHRGSSVPALIPVEAWDRGTRGLEPTSPRVTCVGKVKCRKDACGGTQRVTTAGVGERKEKRTWFAIRGWWWSFGRRASQVDSGGGGGGGGTETDDAGASSAETTPPPLGQLRRFASGREGLRGFEWGDPGVAVEKEERHAEDMEEEGSGVEEEEEEEEEEGQVVKPESAAVVAGGGGGVALEPRKEVNIWRRRTVKLLTPLQV